MDFKFTRSSSAMDGVKLAAHPHPLHLRDGPCYCTGCKLRTADNKGQHYECDTCYVDFHRECAESSAEINHPSHLSHPLTLLTRGTLDCADGRCGLCGNEFRELLYRCPICDFSVDMDCARNPPPLAVDHPKTHDHTLALLPRKVSFACNACGMDGDRSPYVCPPCGFMVHKDCIDLPRLIKINRHQHRIARTYILGPGNWVCGVCRRKVDGKYGAYSCSACNFAAHSKCATSQIVWDGRELEGTAEEIDEAENVKPFRVIDDKVINHFSHEAHDLRLEDGGVCDESKRCQACATLIYTDSFYSCMECDFILHETCAGLPLKKWHVLHGHPFILHVDGASPDEYFQGAFECNACTRLCNGFTYKCCDIKLDVQCGSVSEPFIHKCHPHPLFHTLQDHKCAACSACKASALSCIDCDFALCFECATLPYMVRHKIDEHPLTICVGEDASGPYWCEICEKEIDPKKWFYTCDDCGVTPHLECVLGSFPFMKPGHRFAYMNCEYDVATNNHSSRPVCSVCDLRCEAMVILKDPYTDSFICSFDCLKAELLA